jgi:carbamate kinase
MTAAVQRANVRLACRALAPLADRHQLVISHGNGPQVGLLALQAAAYHEVDPYPLDIIGAQTEGMIGYLIEQEMGNLLPFEKQLASLLTMTEVDPDDPAFGDPSKFVGPVYGRAEAERLAAEKGWVVKPDGEYWRRVVPSPLPRRIFQTRPVRQLLEHGTVVICTGGGGIPTMYRPGTRELVGVEAVIDKDLASAVLATELAADLFVMATDADAVHLDWGTPHSRALRRATPEALEKFEFAPGSMGPKVKAAVDFVRGTGKQAVIGALEELELLLTGQAGTTVTGEVAGGMQFG